MKKTILLFSVMTATALSAQDRPIQVEIVDRTEITMLAAQYDILQREKREAINAQNYNIAVQNFSSFSSDLAHLEKLTNNPKILKEIEKAQKQNERLFNLATRSSYSKEFYKLQNNIKRIAILVNATKETI